MKEEVFSSHGTSKDQSKEMSIMKYTMLFAVTALAMGAASTAHAENERSLNGAARPAYSGAITEIADKTGAAAGSNAASLTSLFAEWDRAGFAAPSKPSQSLVYGRNGYVTSGPGYNAMISLIRSAANDTREGRDQEAATKIAKARSLLAAGNRRQG
jgi:hypothetical protein